MDLHVAEEERCSVYNIKVARLQRILPRTCLCKQGAGPRRVDNILPCPVLRFHSHAPVSGPQKPKNNDEKDFPFHPIMYCSGGKCVCSVAERAGVGGWTKWYQDLSLSLYVTRCGGR